MGVPSGPRTLIQFSNGASYHAPAASPPGMAPPLGSAEVEGGYCRPGATL